VYDSGVPAALPRRAGLLVWPGPPGARSVKEVPLHMGERLEAFSRVRREMNEKILAHDNLVVRRFFNLDGQAYKPGALPSKTKEMLGLVASLVLRCDDCVTYHMIQCYKEGVTRDEFFEIFGVALVVGGSITIPHVRRAVAVLEELERDGVPAMGERPAAAGAQEDGSGA